VVGVLALSALVLSSFESARRVDTLLATRVATR
jgi:hypothetical protein